MDKLTIDDIIKQIIDNEEIQEEIVELHNEIINSTLGHNVTTSSRIKEILLTAKYDCSMLFVSNLLLNSQVNGYYLSTYKTDGIHNALLDAGLSYLKDTLETETLWTLMPESLAKKLIPANELNVIIRARLDATFNTNAKTLKLDTFSYKIFERFILANKNLSGVDSTRYLKLLNNYNNFKLKQQEIDIKCKYIKLIWDNTKTKSIQLSNFIINSTAYNATSTPFAIIDSPVIKAAAWNTEVTFSLYYFNIMTKKLNLLDTTGTLGITESKVHRYITGIPKKTAMSAMDVQYALMKIKVLTHLILHDKLQCPYYKQARDQLINELSDSKNIKKFASMVNIDASAIKAEAQVLTIFKKIKATYKKENDE